MNKAKMTQDQLYQQQKQEHSKLIVEYIEEYELGPNYKENYVVYYDKENDENYIIDYSGKYKYIIRQNSKPPQQVQSQSQPKQQQQQQQPTIVFPNEQYNQPDRYIYGYVDESELNNVDLSNIGIFKDDLRNEYYIKDPYKANKYWVILPHNWDEDENSTYISENDIDFMATIVNLDRDSNRKYILDERDNTRFYIIPNDYIKEFREYWHKHYKEYKEALVKQVQSVQPLQQEQDYNNNNITTNTSTQSKSNQYSINTTHDMIIEYVDEDELKAIDLFKVKIQKDHSYNEYYIQDPTNLNRRWVVLPSNWYNNKKTVNSQANTNEQHDYIFEDEVNFKLIKVFQDAQKRRFIYDNKTNKKKYLVPRVTDYKQSFKYKWSLIDENLKKIKSPKEVRKHKSSNKTESKVKIDPPEIIDLPRSPRPLHHLMIYKVEKSKQDKLNKYAESKNRNQNVMITNQYVRTPLAEPGLVRQKSSSNEMLDRPIAHARMQPSFSPQLERQRLADGRRVNSNDDLLDVNNNNMRSNSARTVKKTVIFNENVKVSDGTSNSYKTAPLKLPTTETPSHQAVVVQSHAPPQSSPNLDPRNRYIREQQPPPIKPREIKPMSDFSNPPTQQYQQQQPMSNNRTQNVYNNPNYQTSNTAFVPNNQQVVARNQNSLNSLNNNNGVIRIKQQGRMGHLIVKHDQ